MAMPVTQADLTKEVIPKLFHNSLTIAAYGNLQKNDQAMQALDEKMQTNPIGRLAVAIADIVAKLLDADPRKIAKAGPCHPALREATARPYFAL